MSAPAELPPVRYTPDQAALQRFGASTRNPHRIHYDAGFARAQGLAGPVVMAQLHGCLLFRAAAEWAGDPGRVVSLGWRNRAPSGPGAELTVSGHATPAGPGLVRLDLLETGPDGAAHCVGYAVVRTG
ncbi:MAG TPA: acyl dehydratase [Pseudonocardia sp.]|nr:acyl dehydratase [Pseudonocardia sp.]